MLEKGLVFLKKSLKGEVKLWEAFWLGWFIPLMALGILIIICIEIGKNININDYLALSLGVVTLIIYFVIHALGTYSIWKCSWNANKRLWRIAARTWMLLPVIFLSSSHFLFLGALCSAAVCIFYFKNKITNITYDYRNLAFLISLSWIFFALGKTTGNSWW
jgi:hypothetical protein